LNSADETLATQRALSDAAGLRRNAAWLLTAAVTLFLLGAGLMLAGELTLTEALRAPLSIALIASLLRSQSTRRMRELEASLAPAHR
jgi:hypothetical protein